MSKQDLKTKVFDIDLYTRNFIWVDVKYLPDSIEKKLIRVARYNSVIKNIDSSSIIQVEFSFAPKKRIKKVTFYYSNDSVEIIEKGETDYKSGFSIFTRRLSPNQEHGEYYILAGLWSNGKHIGTHFEYNPKDSISCLVKPYYDSSDSLRKQERIDNCKSSKN